MGAPISKEMFGFGKRNIDEACSNTSLSKIRYVAVERPKWKVFGKRELRPLHTYTMRGKKGCPCGANDLCKQTVTPKGVTIHYPHKKRFEKRYKPPKIDKSFLENKDRPQVKIVRPKKFGVVPVLSTPIWRMDNVMSPFNKISSRRRRRGGVRGPSVAKESGPESQPGSPVPQNKNESKPPAS